MERQVKSYKKCKDCGKEAYSFQIGWEDPETKEIHWHPERHYNQCKECRKKMYKELTERKKKTKTGWVAIPKG